MVYRESARSATRAPYHGRHRPSANHMHLLPIRCQLQKGDRRVDKCGCQVKALQTHTVRPFPRVWMPQPYRASRTERKSTETRHTARRSIPSTTAFDDRAHEGSPSTVWLPGVKGSRIKGSTQAHAARLHTEGQLRVYLGFTRARELSCRAAGDLTLS